MMLSLDKFVQSFSFNPNRTLHIGTEREGFLINSAGLVVPDAPRVLSRFSCGHPYEQMVGFEFSACQLESRTDRPAATPTLLGVLLEQNERVLYTHLAALGLKLRYDEVGPITMPLDVYPDPKGRYARLAATMSPEILQAACRVAGTHIHIGMPNLGTALRVYNKVRAHCAQLIRMGDGSHGERMKLYRLVASDYLPAEYESVADFYNYAVAHGFADNPRNCWHMIRISKHGTLEFRVFGATESLEKTLTWAGHCQHLCQKYI